MSEPEKALVEKRYDWGVTHSNWTRTNDYCPNCGKLGMWQEDGEGDYYVGSEYRCTGCLASVAMPYYAVPHTPEQIAEAQVVSLQLQVQEARAAHDDSAS